MMKADVLSIFDTIKVCTHYKYQGETIDYLPYDIEDESLTPVYKEIPGWKGIDLTGLTDVSEIPANLNNYIEFLETELETPIAIVSVGPNRKQTIIRDKVLN